LRGGGGKAGGPGGAMSFLRSIADSLPFKTITGHIRSARNTFTDSPLGYGWSWNDLSEGYAAGVDELLFNEGQPPSSEPSMKFIEMFGNALKSRGIKVRDATLEDTRNDTVFTIVSPPLSIILSAMLKPSQNQIAEMLLKTLGAQITGFGTADSGAAVISRQLITWDAQRGGFLIRDGSGLSRNNLLSAETLGKVLGAMYSDTVFYKALPIGSVDGTLHNRFSGTLAAANVRAKSGALANIRSLAGYVDTRTGQRMAFVIMANNYTVPGNEILSIIDKIVLKIIE
jgi:D-alanyl-D-alanine carboxypeptidase/D-alanyl-D-alanine-endopeptidase (penicillin-binding protein 4)